MQPNFDRKEVMLQYGISKQCLSWMPLSLVRKDQQQWVATQKGHDFVSFRPIFTFQNTYIYCLEVEESISAVKSKVKSMV